MATLIKADGTETEVTPADKAHGFTLDEVYKLTDCDIVQVIHLADGRSMLIDEEAKLRSPRQPINSKASIFLAEAGGMPGDYVLGSALVLADLKGVSISYAAL